MVAKELYGEELITAIVKAHSTGGKVLICGNGGLAAEAEHFAAELVGKFAFDIYIPCISLTANTSLVTALANDMGFEEAFAHQVRVFGRPGDVLIGMTTSRSDNILRALDAGYERGIITVVVCGERSGEFDHAYHTYKMETEETAEVQEAALKFLHYIAYNVKKRIQEGPREVILQTPDELMRVYWLAQAARDMGADFAEVGVYKGGSAKFICEAKGDNKDLFLLDTFKGLPKGAPINGLLYEGLYAASLKEVQSELKEYKNVYFLEGLFDNTARRLTDKQFSFVHLDVNLHQSMVACLKFFYPRMVRGGIILVHDYPGTVGVKNAVDEFLADKPEPAIRVADNQCLIVKL